MTHAPIRGLSDSLQEGGESRRQACCLFVVLLSVCVTDLGVAQEEGLLQQRVDVPQRGVVHQEAQARLEVTGDDCKRRWRQESVDIGRNQREEESARISQSRSTPPIDPTKSL